MTVRRDDDPVVLHQCLTLGDDDGMCSAPGGTPIVPARLAPHPQVLEPSVKLIRNDIFVGTYNLIAPPFHSGLRYQTDASAT